MPLGNGDDKAGPPVTIKCARCGKNVNPLAATCPSCGRDPRTGQLPVQQLTTTVRCVQCGSRVRELVAGGCPICGYDPRTGERPAELVESPENPIEDSRVPAALVTFCVFAAVCLILFFYVRSLTTLSHALTAGWNLNDGAALAFQVVLIALFLLFAALAIRSVARMALLGPPNTATQPLGTASVENSSDRRAEEDTHTSQRLRELATLREQGLVSKAEYEAKRSEILADL